MAAHQDRTESTEFVAELVSLGDITCVIHGAPSKCPNVLRRHDSCRLREARVKAFGQAVIARRVEQTFCANFLGHPQSGLQPVLVKSMPEVGAAEPGF